MRRAPVPRWTTAFAVHILVNTQQGACYRTGGRGALDDQSWICSPSVNWNERQWFKG